MAVILLFWSNVELNRCFFFASFSPKTFGHMTKKCNLSWLFEMIFNLKHPKKRTQPMSFLLNFSGKKSPPADSSFASRRPTWGDSEVCFDSRLAFVQRRSNRRGTSVRWGHFPARKMLVQRKQDWRKRWASTAGKKRIWWNFLDIWVNMTPAYMPWKWGILKTIFCGRKNNSKFEVQKASCFYTGKIVSSQRIYTKIAPKPDVFDVLWKEWFQKDLHPEVYQRGKTPEAAMVVGRWSFPIGLKVTFSRAMLNLGG